MAITGDWVPAVSRRRFLETAGVTVAALASGAAYASAAPAGAPRLSGDPFTLGVASGDPSPDGFVIWTRLAPDPLAGDARGGMPDRKVRVRWEVAHDERFRRVVRRGRCDAVPELGHSVHVELQGLPADREFFYRFAAGGAISPVGRTRTAPRPDAAPAALSFAFASCQAYEFGYFAAYRDMAESDLDLVVHLGDYIYAETYLPTGIVRKHDGELAVTLDDFRNRHALYRTDADLQAAHAAAPWLVVFDDHEIENDWAGDKSRNGDSGAPFLGRRAAAFQAYYEHMPLRRRSLPRGPDMEVYRRYAHGRLAAFNMLDTRQYRDDQVDGQFPGGPRDERSLDPSRTLLGRPQERWLTDGLQTSDAAWNVLASQVVMAQYDYDLGPAESVNHDQWDGYVPARDRVFEAIRKGRPRNPVAIAGDWHSSWVNDLKADFADPTSATIGTEFVGPSISTPCTWAPQLLAAWPANPHVKFLEAATRGYVRCTITPEQWLSEYRAVVDVTEPTTPAFTLTSWVVDDGTPGARRTG